MNSVTTCKMTGLHPILQQCLAEPALASSIVKFEKKRILEADWKATLETARRHASLKYITCSDLAAASWCSVWDLALEYRQKGTKLTQSLIASLCQPLFSDRLCHLCGSQIPAHNMTFFHHLCISHLKTPYNDCIASILEYRVENLSWKWLHLSPVLSDNIIPSLYSL